MYKTDLRDTERILKDPKRIKKEILKKRGQRDIKALFCQAIPHKEGDSDCLSNRKRSTRMPPGIKRECGTMPRQGEAAL